jgi:hypothetical protein
MRRLLVILFVLMSALPLLAQTATLKGRVVDLRGAAVASAKVELIAPDQVPQTVTADQFGAYLIKDVNPGSYQIEAHAESMSLAEPVMIELKPGIQVLELRLIVEKVVQELTVQENADSLSTDSSNNASALVLSGSELDALPDDPDDLQADLQALAGPSAGPNGGAIYIDGFSSGDLPAKNAIREIRINQNPFSPEYDKLGYGRIEIFTKPGSDHYHGTVDYNLGDRLWNSRNPYSAEKAPFVLNEFEGSASGPLSKRASFAVDAQRNMVDNGAITSAVTVDPATFVAAPSSSIVTSAQRLTRVSPRVDFQYNPNLTLTFRYGITQADIQDAGIGGFDLASRGYHTQYTNQTAQVSATAVLGQTLNESRFQYYRSHFQTSANSVTPALLVLGDFNGGGSPSSHTLDVQDNFEFQNYTSRVRGNHSWKLGVRLRGQMDDNLSPQNFNGAFTFGGGDLGPLLDSNNQPVLSASGQTEMIAVSSVERYRRTLLFQQLGYTPSQIRALGGGATQFSISTGQPELSVHQFDLAISAGDEWRMRPNLTLSYGLRYEGQSNIHDWRDWAPRVSAAWASGDKKTVLRAGFGMFYDRFALSNTLTAARYNGLVQQQYVVANPDFFPVVPPISALGAAQSQSIDRISSGLRAPYLMQTAVTVERQLTASTTLAVTYTNAHGLDELRSEDINAPLPGTYNSSVPGSGVFPLGHSGPVFLMESSGRYNQNQLVANVKTRLNAGTSLFAFYVLSKAMSNTDGVNTFPANPYDSRGEYGPAATDVRHRITAGGTAVLRWGVRFSPYVIVQSGAPFDITSGNDAYGTTLFNSRPGIATDPTKPGLISTRYGLLDPNPDPIERLLGRNSGRGPALITMNLRIGKAIGFGPLRDELSGKTTQNGGTVPVEAVGNRGLGAILGRPSTAHRYNLSFSISARNLLNHKNPGPIVGDITSPLFGTSNQIAGAPNGEGFSETANNRRLELQVRLTF